MCLSQWLVKHALVVMAEGCDVSESKCKSDVVEVVVGLCCGW